MVRHHDFLDNALAYLRRGWSVVPIRNIGEKKKAAARWARFQTERPDLDTLRQWFRRDDLTGLAVVSGSVSGGLAIRDFDLEDAYRLWANEHPDLARTLPTVKTRRGAHVYFTGPEHFQDCGDGEYRGSVRHFTVLPPSLHPSGSIYRWVVPLPDGPLPEIDPRAVGLLPCNTESTENPADPGDSGDSEEHPLTSSTPPALSVLHGGNEVEMAVMRTLPTRAGERHGKLFDLARQLKALPHLADVDTLALRSVVQQWHRLAVPVIRTQAFEESWIDFLQAWERVRFPAGTSPLDLALQQARQTSPPVKALRFEHAGIRLLVALCWQLHLAAAGGTWFLGCRTVGKLLGVDHSTAWRWLYLLEAEGVLARVSTGSKAAKKASEFRYVA